MKKLSFALLTAALVALASPALADPARVIIRGAQPRYVPPPLVYSPNGGYWSGYDGFHGDPFDRYFDPAGVVPNDTYQGPPAVDLVLARTLDRTGDSMLQHFLKCQARYPSYSAASNSYFRSGIPTACYL